MTDTTAHAPVGARVRIATEGFAEHGHMFRIGAEGVVEDHLAGWAVVRVDGSGAPGGNGEDTQVLDREDYEVLS